GVLRTGMFPQPLLRREMLCAIPPSFSCENFLSGVDYRRFRLFQARSGLRLQGKKDGKSRMSPERFQGSLGPPCQIRDQGLKWASFGPSLRNRPLFFLASPPRRDHVLGSGIGVEGAR